MFINKITGISSNMGFKGYQHTKNNVGETIMKFNYPYNYDDEICEIQIFRVIQTDKYNYKVIEKPIAKITLDKDGKEVNLQRETNLDKDEAFAYKVVRKDKNENVIWEGPDTGVKMRAGDNGEYVFRIHQDEQNLKGSVTLLDKDGKVKIGDDGKPIQQDVWYKSTTEFDGPTMDNYKYTLVKQNGTKPTVQGNGYLAMPDTYRPGVKYRDFNDPNTGEIYEDKDYQKKMEGVVKTFSNMYGGSMAGLELLIPYLKANGFKMLFTTPIANGDDRSSHGYWNKNNMQIAPNMGTTENYNALMALEFKNGISHVFDATLSSEGLEGIHMQYNMRWGEKAQSYYWFRMDSLKDAPLGFGVIPENAKNLRHRIINAPYKYELQSDGQYKKVVNNDYNANKETYYQIYDGTQVSDSQLSKLDKPIQIYDDLKAGKNLDINTHDDTVISYVFQINPNEYDKRIDIINDLNKNDKKNIKLDTPDGTIMTAQFENFKLDKVTEGGYVAWDANTDMVKMNYGISAYDEKLHQAIVDKTQRQHERDMRVRGSWEVQDMAVQVGEYWAQRTKDAHIMYIADTIGDAKTVEKINKLIEEGKLPEEARLTPEQLNNILNGRYKLAPKGVLNKDDATVKALMKLPLDALEFGENTVGVLSTSYFSNRATTEDTVGISRFDLMKNNNPHLVEPYSNVYKRTNDIFNKELKDFAQSVIRRVNETSNVKLIESNGNYTEFGEYVIELVGKDITKYAMLRSLAGNTLKSKQMPNGELTYNYDEIRNATTLKALGINASNPTEEAEILQRKIIRGLHNLNENDIAEVSKSISARIKGKDTNSFRISEAMEDISGLGLNYRLDAAKDLVDIDAIRNRDADFSDTWTHLIKFWSKYVQGVKSVNPQSYIVAEMTDVADVMRETYGGPESCPYNGWTNINNVKYNGEPDAMTKFFNETGITSEAAYAYFFTELLTNFSRGFETGKNKCDTHDDFKHKYDLLINTRSVDYLRNLYTFMGNHDKMRTIHGLAVDMELYHSTLYYRGDDINNNRPQRIDVMKVLSGAKDEKDIPLELKLNIDNLDYFRTVSARAVAQSKLLISSIDEDFKNSKIPQEDLKLIREALIDLANGNYLNSKTSEKMTKINIPELSSIENAVQEVAKIARANGVSISETDIQTIIKNANALDYKNYTVKGDFDYTNPKKFGDDNTRDLIDILGSSDNAMKYSVYTVQIAKMIKDAANGTANADAINSALKDFVRKYDRTTISQNMDGLKMFEDPTISRKKNGYAARDFRIAMEEAINQAEFKSGRVIKDKEDIINTVYKSATEPAIQKHAMILSFLGSLSGISTLYAGDELGDTGSEDKTKNIWLQNRMPSMWSEVEDPNSKIGQIKKAYQTKTLDAMQNKANLKVLQNGTPYTMDVQTNGRDRNHIRERIAEIDTLCKDENGLPKNSSIYADLQKEKEELQTQLAKAAFLIHGADGDMAISVFNAGGIDHNSRVNYFKKLNIEDRNKRIQFFKDNNIDESSIDNPYVPIQKRSEVDALLLGSGITIPVGTLFMNADGRDKVQYVVNKIGDKLGVVRKDGKKIVLDGLTAKNGVMVLRKFLSFKGKQHTPIFNQKYNIVSNPYETKENAEAGKKLSIIAK